VAVDAIFETKISGTYCIPIFVDLLELMVEVF
jgi:hypothetical protein